MNKEIQIVCALCGPAFAILFTAGWWFIAGFVPPHSPELEELAIAEFYQRNIFTIRFGILTAMISSALLIPFGAVIAVQMKRIEDDVAPILSIVEVMAATVTSIILLLATVVWTVAAFRPERAAEVILSYNDFAWILLLMTFSPFLVQFTAIGFALLSDRNDPPLFPQWAGYFNFWLAFLAVPGGLITFFKSGPFAWNGLLAFWIPIVAFIAWFFVMAPLLIQAIRRNE
jgi:hypothetical protein